MSEQSDKAQVDARRAAVEQAAAEHRLHMDAVVRQIDAIDACLKHLGIAVRLCRDAETLLAERIDECVRDMAAHVLPMRRIALDHRRTYIDREGTVEHLREQLQSLRDSHAIKGRPPC